MQRLHQHLSNHSKHYKAWHEWSGSHKAHWAVFVAIELLVSVSIHTGFKSLTFEPSTTLAQNQEEHVNSNQGTVSGAYDSAGQQQCAPASPSVSISPSSQTITPGGTLAYSISVKNNDSSICGGSSYTISPTLPNGFLQSPGSITTTTIAPGARQTFIVKIAAPDTATAQGYGFSQKAANVANTAFSGTASASFFMTQVTK